MIASPAFQLRAVIFHSFKTSFVFARPNHTSRKKLAIQARTWVMIIILKTLPLTLTILHRYRLNKFYRYRHIFCAEKILPIFIARNFFAPRLITWCSSKTDKKTKKQKKKTEKRKLTFSFVQSSLFYTNWFKFLNFR